MVKRLARPHRSGGEVIERAAILAEGSDFTTVVAWIEAHDGQAETAVAAAAKGGLYAARGHESAAGGSSPALRYILPRGALD